MDVISDSILDNHNMSEHSDMENDDGNAMTKELEKFFNDVNFSYVRQKEKKTELNLTEKPITIIQYSPEKISNVDYESLNYDIIENDLYRNEEFDPNFQERLFYKSMDRWIVSLLIGIITAILALFINIIMYYNAKLKFQVLINPSKIFKVYPTIVVLAYCDQHSHGNGCLWIPFLVWAIYNTMLVLIAALMVLYIAPAAAGSGIPQLKSFLNGVRIPEIVCLKTLIVKVIGVAFSVSGGLAVGKEGPMIHAGSIVGAGISQGRIVTFPMDFHIFKYFRNDRDKRDFASIGAAAGISAAFAAPIGGVLYSLEEGGAFWNEELTWRMVFTAMVSTFTLNSLQSVFYDQGTHLDWNGLANFGVYENNSYSVWEIPLFILVGIFGGLSGAFFNMLNVRMTAFRKRYFSTLMSIS